MSSLFAHPLLADCRRLFLRDFAVSLNIGVHASEKRGQQRVLINVEVFVPLAASTPYQDSLDEVVDYDFIREVIIRRVAQGHIHLQETLCDAIAQALLVHPDVRAVRVATEKPDVYPDCGSIGVEIFHLRPNARAV